MNRIVGLTGGMGSGKTTVAGMFAGLGVPVYNSDREARRLMETSPSLRKDIIALLGEKAYRGESPDSAYIASRVFPNPVLLARLNALVHPEVARDFMHWVGEQRAPYVIQEAAILFENGRHEIFDAMILVTAPKKERIKRIQIRDGSNRQDIEARMSHQWSDKKKAALADFVIRNSDLEKTREEVGRIHRELLKKSA